MYIAVPNVPSYKVIADFQLYAFADRKSKKSCGNSLPFSNSGTVMAKCDGNLGQFGSV